jgi:hypothetical protein
VVGVNVAAGWGVSVSAGIVLTIGSPVAAGDAGTQAAAVNTVSTIHSGNLLLRSILLPPDKVWSNSSGKTPCASSLLRLIDCYA